MHRLFFVLFLLFTLQSIAVEVANLTQAAMPVASESAEERQRAVPEILRKVILKLVGNRALVEGTDLSPILAQADHYIQQYEYRRINPDTEDVTQPDKLQLVVTFHADSLRKAILELGLPVWSQSRPEILVWLGVEEPGKRFLAGADDMTSWSQGIRQAADERGLPVLFPVLDLQEQRLVTFDALSAGLSDTIKQASQRYDAPVILIARATVDDAGMATINWSAQIGEQLKVWQSRGSQTIAIEEGMGQLADYLGTQLAQYRTFAQAYPVRLHITGVKDYADYVRLEKYLRALQYVSAVAVSRIEADNVEVTLTFAGNRDALGSMLAIDHVLTAQSAASADKQYYRLLPWR